MIRRFCCSALLFIGCGQLPPPVDAGANDTVVHDAGVPDGGHDAGVPDAGGLRVLFIGNSYTFFNDLPGMLTNIAATTPAGPSITTTQVAEPGATLEDHWLAGRAQGFIVDGGWTHVVLQEQSVTSTRGSGFADLLGDFIVDAGPRPVMFVTWARAAGDGLYAGPNALFLSPAHMQDRLTSAYAQAARRWPTSMLACVGEAFRASVVAHPQIELYVSDRSHPTVQGTFLAASTFYVALTGQPVSSTSHVPAGVSATEAAALRNMALVGSRCADVRVKGILRVLPRAHTGNRALPDGGQLFDYGRAGSPLTAMFDVTNSGETTVEVSDGLSLSGPFGWTSGSYPGGTSSLDAGSLASPPCGATLPPRSTCSLSVTYSGAMSAEGEVSLNVRQAYFPTVSRRLSGESTDRALLTVSEAPGWFGCTEPSCLGAAWFLADAGAEMNRSFVVSNRGRLAATSISAGALSEFFSWSPVDGGTLFPGGLGAGTVGGETHAFCSTSTLGPGQQCALSVRFTAPLGGIDGGVARGQVELTYSDALGPVTPNAVRSIVGEIEGGGQFP